MGRKYHPNDIKRLRLKMEPAWQQRELAERSGCTQSEISAYERGTVQPSLAKALCIARAFGRVVEDVFFGLAEATRRAAPASEQSDDCRGGV